MNGPKLSTYSKAIVTDSTSLKNVLTMALGVKGCVRKKRLLFHFDQTRIHVDEVSGLGSFLELEVNTVVSCSCNICFKMHLILPRLF